MAEGCAMESSRMKFMEIAIAPPPSRTERVILKVSLSCSGAATNEEKNIVKQTIEINLRLNISDPFFCEVHAQQASAGHLNAKVEHKTIKILGISEIFFGKIFERRVSRR